MDDVARLELLQRDGGLGTPLRLALAGQLVLPVLQLRRSRAYSSKSPRWQVMDAL